VHITVAVGSPFEDKVLNYEVVQKILCELITSFSPKIRNIYSRNTFWRGLQTGWRRGKCLARVPLNTTLVAVTWIECTPAAVAYCSERQILLRNMDHDVHILQLLLYV